MEDIFIQNINIKIRRITYHYIKATVRHYLPKPCLFGIPVKGIYAGTKIPLPFIPSHQGRGNRRIPSPLAGEGQGEGCIKKVIPNQTVPAFYVICQAWQESLFLRQ